MGAYSETVKTAQEYYNSDDADRFYATVWGGEDIHIGLYNDPEESIRVASRRTVERMAKLVDPSFRDRILDIGAGYGGSARYLAQTFSCQVECLNLSEVQNQRNRRMNEEQGLANRIGVVDGSFEDIPFEDGSFDVLWSQDAILHSGNRRRVLGEVARVLKPHGRFVFTDPMQADDCPVGVLEPVLERIHLDTMGSPGFYRTTGAEFGLTDFRFEDQTHQLVNHYSAVLREITRRSDELQQVCGRDYLDRMDRGLKHWINAGKNGYLAWGIMQMRLS